MGNVDYNGSSFPSGSTTAFTFDTAGRMTRSVKTTSTFTAPDTTGTGNKQGGYSAGAAITTTLTTDSLYDAENHTVSRHGVSVRARTLPDQPSSTTTTTTDGGGGTLGWGPNGHPLVVNAVNQPGVTQMTLHWDGDVILFITDSAGNVVDFKAGLDGEIAPRDPNQSALVVYERDSAGVIIGSSVNGTTSLAPLDAWDGAGPNFGVSSYAQYVRPDGFEIVGIQINGVRAFDPALGSWTTPDAFEGDIHDPASQQKYMWNRGNPVDYSDPSGYNPAVIAGGAEAVVAAIFVFAGLAYICGNSDYGDKSMALGRATQEKINGAVMSAASALGDAFRGKSLPPTGPAGGAIRRGDSVQYYDKDGFRTKRVDLSGKAHGGVPTPHVEEYESPNIAPDGTKRGGNAKKGVRPATAGEQADAGNRPQGASK
jgi:RHS repeat-associated protein